MMNFSIFCSSFSGSSLGQTKTKTDADVRPSLLIYTEKVASAVCVDVQTTQLRKKKEKERELDAIDAFPTEMGTSHSLRITNQPPHFDTVVNATLLTNSLSLTLSYELSLSGVLPTLTLTGLIPLSHTKLRSLLPLSILSHSPVHTKYEQALAPSLNSHSFRALFPSICSKASFWASCRYVCRAYNDDNDNDNDDDDDEV